MSGNVFAALKTYQDSAVEQLQEIMRLRDEVEALKLDRDAWEIRARFAEQRLLDECKRVVRLVRS